MIIFAVLLILFGAFLLGLVLVSLPLIFIMIATYAIFIAIDEHKKGYTK